MTSMLEGIIVGIVTASIMILINALVRRSGVKTRTDRMEESLKKLEKGHEVTMQVLLPLVLALKGNKPNGEVERALQLLNNYLIQK